VITLARLTAKDAAQVLHLQLGDGQQAFVGPIADMVSEVKPGVFFHAINDGDTAVGFYKIDNPIRAPRDYVRGGDAELRGFLIGAQYQGNGVARAAMGTFSDHMRTCYPDLKSVVLTVNTKNPAALRSYLGGGFCDAGALYHGGRAGPQHVLRLVL